MDKDDRRVADDDSQCRAVRGPDLPAIGARATSPVLDNALDAQAEQKRRVLVDLTGLAFIDSYGLARLERILRRAHERDQALCFRHGPHVGQRPRELTHAQMRFRAVAARRNAPSSDDYLFALATASVDVDHHAPGDRPRAAQGGYPGQAAGASDAPPLPSVARAAPRTRSRAAAFRRSELPRAASPHDE
jgi:hypothetical protein